MYALNSTQLIILDVLLKPNREGINKKNLNFLEDMSANLWPPPSDHLADEKKVYFFSQFFIHIPIEPECFEMDKKMGYDRPPRYCIHYIISMVVLDYKKYNFTLQKNAFNKKNYSGHVEYF